MLTIKFFIDDHKLENVKQHSYLRITIRRSIYVCHSFLTSKYHMAQLYGEGKYWQKVYLERVVRKYLANLHLNKTICTYSSVLEAISLKKYFTKLLHVCNQVCVFYLVSILFIAVINPYSLL